MHFVCLFICLFNNKNNRKEGNVLFYDALKTFYLRLYVVIW